MLHARGEGDPVAPVVQSLLQRTTDARLLHFGLYSRPHKPFWYKGRVLLVGDAVSKWVGFGKGRRRVERPFFSPPCCRTHSAHTACVFAKQAHATLPHVGQGANMAIEDACVLADCLEQARFRDVEAALASFYERRRERTRRIVDSSKYVGWLLDAESPWGVWARNHFLRWALKADLYMKFAEKELFNHSPLPVSPGKGREGSP